MRSALHLVVTVGLAITPGVGAAPPVREPAPQGSQRVSQRVFRPTDEVFANPERGWIWTNHVFCGPVPIAAVDFDALRDQGITIVDAVYVLDEHRETPLSAELLAGVWADFTLARDEGVKLLPRFTYNWNAVCTGEEDATIERIRQHLAQLAPILVANEDVLLALQVSFIGRFGEMHSSSNGLVDPGTVRLSADGILAFEAILDALPLKRSWCIRYPQQKRQLFAGGITPGEAFGFSDRARLGLANHGFGADETDFGTWSPDPFIRADEKAWAEHETRFVPQFGEPAAISSTAIGFDPSYVLGELERFHYSGLVINQQDALSIGMYDAWLDAGIFEQMGRRFGYRYVLETAAVVPPKAGDIYEVTLRVRNEGYAVPINRRAAEIVLRSDSGVEVIVPTSATDIRRDFPAAGESGVVSLRFAPPPATPPGEYEMLLWLPDPSGSLRARAEYAVRLANIGVWEPGTGMNRLGLRVVID